MSTVIKRDLTQEESQQVLYLKELSKVYPIGSVAFWTEDVAVGSTLISSNLMFGKVTSYRLKKSAGIDIWFVQLECMNIDVGSPRGIHPMYLTKL